MEILFINKRREGGTVVDFILVAYLFFRLWEKNKRSTSSERRVDMERMKKRDIDNKQNVFRRDNSVRARASYRNISTKGAKQKKLYSSSNRNSSSFRSRQRLTSSCLFPIIESSTYAQARTVRIQMIYKRGYRWTGYFKRAD